MQTYQASEAKAKFLRILDDVEAGQTVVITRHGKAIARVTPNAEARQTRAEQAAANIRALRKTITPISIEEILSARDEGRM